MTSSPGNQTTRCCSSPSGSCNISEVSSKAATSGWTIRVWPDRFGAISRGLPTVDECYAGHIGELGDEDVECRVGTGRPGAKVAHLLVGDRAPVGERRLGTRIGEQETGEVGLAPVEDAERSNDPFEGGIPRQHVAKPVEHERCARLEGVEHCAHALGVFDEPGGAR